MKNRKSGLTLVELLIIIAIIAILLALAVPPVWDAKERAKEIKDRVENRSKSIDKEYMDKDKKGELNAANNPANNSPNIPMGAN